MESQTILCFDRKSRQVIKAKCDAVGEDKWAQVGNVSTSDFSDGWSTMTFSAVAIDDTVYVLTWLMEAFSIKPFSKNSSWENHSDLLYGHGPEPPVATYAGTIYVCGGGWQRARRILPDGSVTQPLSNRCEVFDTDENRRWENIGSLLHEKRRNSMIEVQGKLYCIGGLGKADTKIKVKVEPGVIKRERKSGFKKCKKEFEDCEVEALKSVEMYDPDTNSWVEKALLKIARVAPGVAKYEEWMFALGGRSSGSHVDGHYLNSIECFNTRTNVWQAVVCEMEVARRKFVAHCTQNEIILVGGESDVTDYSPGSIEKIKVVKNADEFKLRRSSLMRCFYKRDINCLATVFMQSPKYLKSVKCEV